jgi:hypothetical protein
MEQLYKSFSEIIKSRLSQDINAKDAEAVINFENTLTDELLSKIKQCQNKITSSHLLDG